MGTNNNSQIICADSLKHLPTMSPGSVDIAITSPRYNFGKNYHGVSDNTSMNDYFEEMELLAKGLLHVVKQDGVLFLNVGTNSGNPLHDANVAQQFVKAGWVLQERIIWQKSNHLGQGHFTPIGGKRYLNNLWESVFLFSKDGMAKLDRLAIGVPYTDQSNTERWGHHQEVRCAGDVWFIPYKTIKDRKKRCNHEATFPSELASRCIRLMAHDRKDLVVLDPCCGTGTVPKVATEMGHIGIGIELSDMMAASAKQGLDEVLAETAEDVTEVGV